MKKILSFFMCSVMLLMAALCPAVTANAATVYLSDGMPYDEGYIFIGESHMHVAAFAMKQDAAGNIPGLDGVKYYIKADSSIVSNDHGGPGTFTMAGNLFFVFEGTDKTDELQKQISKEYIYSDGAGKQGGAVQKIHNIMKTNPNIAHWNIISFHGANSALHGGQPVADYYVASYRNWIDYEFPEADCYFLPQSTMTKNFKIFGRGDKEALNRSLAKAFPDQYIDLMPFFWEHYPWALMDPDQKSDLVHWSSETYYEMISMIIKQIQEKRGVSTTTTTTYDFTVTEAQAVLYTNDTTVIYTQPDTNSSVIVASCDAGLPIQVTGLTDNGYFRIDLDGTVGYILGSGLVDPRSGQ
ncbi:MAG: hypothetical protein K1W16_04165 [Lachnospiraceae bacterium]